MGEMADLVAGAWDVDDSIYMPTRPIVVRVSGVLVRETERAFLFRWGEKSGYKELRGKEVWLPKSRCRLREDGRMEVPEWLLDRKIAEVV